MKKQIVKISAGLAVIGLAVLPFAARAYSESQRPVLENPAAADLHSNSISYETNIQNSLGSLKAYAAENMNLRVAAMNLEETAENTNEEAEITAENEISQKSDEEAETENAEEMPMIQQESAAEETPVIEEAPAAEETPVIEEAPVVEEVPVIEEAQVVEEVPVIEEAPVVEETPVIEEAPVVEEAPVIEEAPAAKEAPAEITIEEAPAKEAPVTEEAPAEEPVSNAYMHGVNTSSVSSALSQPYSYGFLDAIRSGSNKLYYNGDHAAAEASLSEVVSYYCGISGGIDFYEVEDESGTFIEIDNGTFAGLQGAVADADAAWNAYIGEVANACYSLNLNTSDKDLVDQINAYICNRFSYQITNASMPSFVFTNMGQCFHYSKMFMDMCNSVGISAWQVQGNNHAWNNVAVDGVTYSFDSTYNDTSGNMTAYSWN